MFLTDALIKRAKSTSKQTFLWDHETPGFGVRIYESGIRTFVFRYYYGEKRHIERIGAFGVLNTDQARATARELLLKRCLKQHGVTSARTFKIVAEDYIEVYSRRHKKTWTDDIYRLDKHILPYIGHIPVNEVSRQDIEAIHARISETAPYQANRVVELIGSIFQRAIEWKDVETKPTKGIRMNREKKRTVRLEPGQLPQLWESLAKEDYVYEVMIHLYLLLGVRKSELLSLKWENVDLEVGYIKIPETKNGEEFLVALPKDAVRLFRTLRRKNEWVFPSRYEIKGHMLDFKRTWERIRTRAGLPGLRLHDLRRTLGSWLAEENYSDETIREVLNHKSFEASQHYTHFRLNKKREVLESHAEMIRNQINRPLEEPDYRH